MEAGRYIALGRRMFGIPEVTTLGVRPNFTDYTPDERMLINDAHVILFPTLNYSQFFTTLGKEIFPSVETYLYADEKIKQSTLFYMLNLPHPRTRFYFRPKAEQILKDFSFPFIAKIPRASARGRGVFRISSEKELTQYLDQKQHIAYIQEYIPHDRDLRIILINYRLVLAYWRYSTDDNFKTNIHQGGIVCFDNIPEEAISLAQDCARKCKFNDVGLDLIEHQGKWHLIEANMQYGRQGMQMKGMVLKEILRERLLSGTLFN